jgi:cytochrome c-type biogenesis protein CcmH/NrfF
MNGNLVWIVPLVTTLAGAIFALGRLWQKQTDHEAADAEKFEFIDEMFAEIRHDIKLLLQK